MKKKLLLSFFIFIITLESYSQDTFSIVAADSATKYVGSAGASCVDLIQFTLPIDFLGDVIPGKGAINTQASYDPDNQAMARDRMNAGLTPQEIIHFVNENDAGTDSTIRQYGIVEFKGNSVLAAGYTGRNCIDYKNNITGSINGIYYSIQGNILLGPQVLDSMEARFRRAQGDLACRLMAALQGAKIQGADTRCTGNGTSSLFAFLKVSRPTDAYGSPYFMVGVKTQANAHIEPIDSLQKLFNAKNPCWPVGMQAHLNIEPRISPNPFSDNIMIAFEGSISIKIYDLYGSLVFDDIIMPGESIPTKTWSCGTYFISCRAGDNFFTKKLVKN
jgi:uncharacterized Ntn-hydrolase superfamily protein